MRTCLIFGHDGFELEILYNCLHFYKKQGFHCFYANQLKKADLLVIVRPANVSLPIQEKNYSCIHVYDYVGTPYDQLLQSLPIDKTHIFCTSDNQRDAVVKGRPEWNNSVKAILPPVITSLWVKPVIDKSAMKFVHIGNYKPYFSDGTDVYSNNFLRTIERETVDVWGGGWEVLNKPSLTHGKLNLFKVAEVYANTHYAFGMMYPFQRAISFSSRFWQAPLTGCKLLSEPGIYDSIPGVVVTDYTPASIDQLKGSNYNRQQVQQEAIEYWNQQLQLTTKAVKQSFTENSVNNSLSITKLLVLLRYKTINTIRKFWHKYK